MSLLNKLRQFADARPWSNLQTQHFVWSIATIIICLLVLLSWEQKGERIKINFEAKSFFALREAINPKQIQHNLKILIYDDRAVSTLKTFDPPLRHWANLLLALEKSGARTITIDRLFDSNNFKPESIKRFNTMLTDLKVPLVSIAFVNEQKIPFRKLLNGFKQWTREYEYSGKKNFYGANPDLRVSLRNPGHAVYEDGFFWSAYKSQTNEILPHVALVLANILGVSQPTKNRQLVNLLSIKQLKKHSYAMLPALTLAYQKKPIPIINKGDHVLILPAMFTGNTDWASTPMGVREGGYVLASIVNSAISGDWIKDFAYNPLYVLVPFLLIIGLASKTKLSLLSYTVAGSVFLLVFVSHLLFVFFDIAFPYLLPSAAIVTGFGASAILKLQQHAVEEMRMANELETAKLVQEQFVQPVKSTVFNLQVHHTSMEECCGDWWGHAHLEDGVELFFIADGTGHGAPAALVTAMAFSTFHMLIKDLPEELSEVPSHLLYSMNSVLALTATKTSRKKASMTAVAIVLDRNNEKAFVSSAGHVPPLKISGATVKVVNCTGDPVGVFPETTFKSKEVDFLTGDRLVLMTDGVFERENEKGVLLTRTKLKRHIKQNSHLSNEEMLKSIMAFADDWSQTVPVNDDVTLMIMG